MLPITSYLIKRQVEGKLTTLRQLAQRFRVGNLVAVSNLEAAATQGELSWAHFTTNGDNSFQSHTAVWLTDASAEVLEELGLPKEELILPTLTDELIGNYAIWAARIYQSYNSFDYTFLGIDPSTIWMEQQVDLYRGCLTSCLQQNDWPGGLPEDQRLHWNTFPYTQVTPEEQADPEDPYLAPPIEDTENATMEVAFPSEVQDIEPDLSNLPEGLERRPVGRFQQLTIDFPNTDEQPEGQVAVWVDPSGQAHSEVVADSESTGTCGICGKTLTRTESVQRGIGPICFGRLASYSGYTAERLADPEQTTDEVLSYLVSGLRAQDVNRVELYDSEEEAAQDYPEGIISLRKLADEVLVREGIPVTRMVRAMGGDRGANEPLSPAWKFFKINRSRYFSANVLNLLDDLRGMGRNRNT